MVRDMSLMGSVVLQSNKSDSYNATTSYTECTQKKLPHKWHYWVYRFRLGMDRHNEEDRNGSPLNNHHH